MQTLKPKTHATDKFFATVNQISGGSSQLPITAERAVVKSFSTGQGTKQCSRRLEESANHLNDGSEKRVRPLSFEL